MKTAGLDAAGASALFTQTAQALGSNIVQAEELNTIIDQSPALVVALAKELGLVLVKSKSFLLKERLQVQIFSELWSG